MMKFLLLLAGLAWSADMTAPGPHHARLADFAGSWNIHTRFWQRPGAEPEESDGTAELQLILGGRFLEQRQKGHMMGKPPSGIGYVGFDNAKGRYVSLWFDDLSTTVLRTEGPPTPSGKTIRTRGTIHDAAAGKPLRIEEIDAPRVFAFTWGSPGKPLEPTITTTARFTLAADETGTVLTVVETGFDRLTDPAWSLDDHRGGWDFELDELVDFLARSA